MITVPAVFTAIDRFSAPVRSMSAATASFAAQSEAHAARAGRAFTLMATPVRALTRQLSSFGLMLGGFAIVGGIASSIGIIKDFEQANKTLASVMQGTTRQEFIKLAEDAKRLGSITSKTATEVVGLQEVLARRGFGAGTIMDMTEAIIDSSVAMNADLSDTAELLSAVINSFDNLDSTNSVAIMDALTKSTQTTALDFQYLADAMPKVASAANASNISYTEMTGLLGMLANGAIEAGSAGRSLRNIFILSSKAGKDYRTQLQAIADSQDGLKKANELFGAENAVQALILSKSIDQIDAYAKSLDNAGGTAKKAAETQLDSLNGALTLLTSAYEGFILSTDDGTGAITGFLKGVVSVATEMLVLESGTKRTEEQLSKVSTTVKTFARIGLLAIKVLIGYAAILLVAKVWATALAIRAGILNTVLFIQSIRAGLVAAATTGMSSAYISAGIATKIYTAYQWALNAALSANPIGLFIIAIAGLITLIGFAIVNFDTWGKKLLESAGAIGFVIVMIEQLRRKIDELQDVGSWEGFKGIIKSVGVTISEYLLSPIIKMLDLLALLPNEIGGQAFENLSASLQALPSAIINNQPLEPLNPEKQKQDNLTETINNNTNETVTFDFKNVPVGMEILNGDMMPILTTTTR